MHQSIVALIAMSLVGFLCSINPIQAQIKSKGGNSQKRNTQKTTPAAQTTIQVGYLDFKASGQVGLGNVQGTSMRLDWSKPLVYKENLHIFLRLSGGLYHASSQFSLAAFAKSSVLNPNFGFSISNGNNPHFRVSLQIAGGTAFKMSSISNLTNEKPAIAFTVAPLVYMNIKGQEFQLSYNFQFVGTMAELRADPWNNILVLPTVGYPLRQKKANRRR